MNGQCKDGRVQSWCCSHGELKSLSLQIGCCVACMVSVMETSKDYINTINKTLHMEFFKECRLRPIGLITRYVEGRRMEEGNRQAHELEAFKQQRDASSLFEVAKPPYYHHHHHHHHITNYFHFEQQCSF